MRAWRMVLATLFETSIRLRNPKRLPMNQTENKNPLIAKKLGLIAPNMHSVVDVISGDEEGPIIVAL